MYISTTREGAVEEPRESIEAFFARMRVRYEQGRDEEGTGGVGPDPRWWCWCGTAPPTRPAASCPAARPASNSFVRFYPATAIAAFALLGFVLLLTPTGALPSPRWRWWANATVAALIAPRHPTLLWARNPEVAAEIDSVHTNEAYLSGFTLPSGLMATDDLEKAMRHAELLIVGVPTTAMRSTPDFHSTRSKWSIASSRRSSSRCRS